MGKYDPLREHLISQIGHVDELALSFAEIERFVGRLPAAARVQHSWWETMSATKPAAYAWLSAGWRVQSVDQVTERVIFSRDKTVTREGITLMSPPPIASCVDKPSVTEVAGISSVKSIAGHGESSNSTSHRSPVGELAIALGAATATGAATGVGGIIGLAHLPWWALALLTAAAGAVGFTVGQAITSHDPADTARWWAISTLVILLVCAGAFTYHKSFDPLTHRAQTYQFVVNGNESNFIPLYGEAGGLEQSLATGNAGQNGLIGGQTYNFDCWTTGRDGAKWFRYERFGQTWWAPSALLHLPAGENQTGMPHC
jgi:hypothetical protein